MASYIPGIPDYIPHVQPFRPDFNFYAAALERKESQYKEGYNKISGLYGTLLNSPMLRDDNNEKRDQFFKDVENNIQRISGMDLSLEENVDSAYKVFQPIIDDSNIHKDIVFTKGYQNELQRGEGFRNCLDEKKCGGRYHPDAIRALNYQAEDFRNASAEDALQMNNPRFTPWVNVRKDGVELAKEMKFGVTRSISHGGYIHEYHNGTLLEGPLKDYLYGVYKNDGVAIDMYKTQAYLHMRDGTKAYAQEHGISEDEAENVYLNDVLKELDKKAELNLKTVDNTISITTAKKNVLAKKIEDRTEPRFDLQKAIEQLNELGDQIEKSQSAKQGFDGVKQMIDKSAIIGADKKSLRFRVNNAMADALLQNDMKDAAIEYSSLTYEDKMTVDPYGLAAQKQMYEVENIKLKDTLYKQNLGLNWNYKLDHELQLKNILAIGTDAENIPYEKKGMVGTTTGPGTYLISEGFNRIQESSQEITKGKSEEYLTEVYSRYKTIYDSVDPYISKDDKKIAITNLKNIFGNKINEQGELTGELEKLNSADIYNLYKRALVDSKSSALYRSEKFNHKLAIIESQVDDGYKAWNAQSIIQEENNTEIKRYINAEAGSEIKQEDKENINRILLPKGRVATFHEFATDYTKQHGPTSIKEIQKLYGDAHDNYIDLVNSDNPRIKLKSWDGNLVLVGGGGREGGTFGLSLRGDAPLSEAYTSLFSVKKNIDKLAPGDFHIVAGGANGFASMEDVADAEDTSAQSLAIFNALMTDLKSKKKRDETVADISYSTVAAGNAYMTAVHINLSSNWIKDNAGTENKAGITAGIDPLKAEGITILIPEDKADNNFYKSSKASLNTVILNSGQVLGKSYGKDGFYSIQRKGNYYNLSGSTHGYDEYTGKPITKIISEPHLPLSTDVNILVDGYDNGFSELRDENIKIESELLKDK